MRSVITLITAAAFLLHLALGCCSHHAHAAEQPAGFELGRPAHSAHGCCGHSDRGGNDHSPGQDKSHKQDDSQCPEHRCDVGQCTFMTTAKTVVAKAVYFAALPLFVAEPAARVPISAMVTATIDSGGLIELPVRAHLWNQILLN